MSDLLVGLLGAMLATNAPAAVSNLVADTTGLSVSVAASNDPVTREYENLLTLDNDAMTDIEKWSDQSGQVINGGILPSTLTLDQRIQARLKTVREAYENFLQHHPEHAKARLAYGSFLNETRDEEGAVAQWEKARALDPSNPAAWNNLANYYGHRGPTTNAFICYAKAIELNPRESVYYHNFAVTVYLFRKDAEDFYHLSEPQVFEKALTLYREAMKLDPNNFILASDYAECFYGTHPPRWEDGLIAWDGALKIAHDDVEREGVYIHLARINWKLNRFADARRWLDQVTNEGYAVLKKRLARNLNETEHGTNNPAHP